MAHEQKIDVIRRVVKETTITRKDRIISHIQQEIEDACKFDVENEGFPWEISLDNTEQMLFLAFSKEILDLFVIRFPRPLRRCLEYLARNCPRDGFFSFIDLADEHHDPMPERPDRRAAGARWQARKARRPTAIEHHSCSWNSLIIIVASPCSKTINQCTTQ